MLQTEPLEPRSTPALYAAVGPDVFEVTAAGDVLRAFQPFESRAVPVSVAAADGLVFVGAGAGGGPRVSAFSAHSFAERWSVFVGDPASREGVDLAALSVPLRAEPHPASPADARSVAAVQAHLDQLPPERVAAIGDARVYAVGGPLTDLPEFAHLAGVPTGTTLDDPARLYDTVGGATLPGAAYVRDPGATPNEVAHLYGYASGLYEGLTLDEIEALALDLMWT